MALSLAYLIAAVISVLALWRLLIITEYQKSTYYALLYACVTVVNIAYFFLSISTTSEEALLATKFTYFGGTFQILFLVLCMCQICGFGIKHSILIPITLIDIEILFSVFGTGYYSRWHYTSYELAQENGYSYLVKSYGPHHTFYMIYVGLSMLIPIIIVIYAATKRRQVSWIYTMMLGLGEISAIIIYLVEKSVGLHVDLLPFAYVFLEIILLAILSRIALYDVTQNAQLTLSNSGDHGYVILDTKGRLVGCDKVARKFFPELNELYVDCKVDQPYLKSEFEDWIKNSKSEKPEAKLYERGDYAIKVEVQPFYSNRGKKQRGYLIQMIDDTRNQKYIRNLTELLETDQLTGIFNRRSYEGLLDQIRGGMEYAAIVSFDVNGLKSANDNHGHKAGDELIKGVAECIEKCFGRYGRCFRTGGDEFMAILTDDSADLYGACTDFENSVRNWKGQILDRMSVSYGMELVSDNPGRSIDEMLFMADKKMYAAKARYYEQSGIDRRKN